tara:strand:- start:781 stop:909 length:129 start_codon:yes stop_codon:yes gene_type:complete
LHLLGEAVGYAGMENPLLYKENCDVVLGDAKETLTALIGELK